LFSRLGFFFEWGGGESAYRLLTSATDRLDCAVSHRLAARLVWSSDNKNNSCHQVTLRTRKRRSGEGGGKQQPGCSGPLSHDRAVVSRAKRCRKCKLHHYCSRRASNRGQQIRQVGLTSCNKKTSGNPCSRPPHPHLSKSRVNVARRAGQRVAHTVRAVRSMPR